MLLQKRFSENFVLTHELFVNISLNCERFIIQSAFCDCHAIVVFNATHETSALKSMCGTIAATSGGGDEAASREYDPPDWSITSGSGHRYLNNQYTATADLPMKRLIWRQIRFV